MINVQVTPITLEVQKSDPVVLEMGFNFVAPSLGSGDGLIRFDLLFTQSSLSIAGLLVVNHGLGVYPSSVKVQNESGEQVMPDDWKDADVNTGILYLQTATPIVGQWLLILGV